MIALHDRATAFHSSAWARVLTETYAHKPLYLHFSQEGKTSALLPLMEVKSIVTGTRGVSVPFSDLCPPLVFSGFDERLLMPALERVATERKWRHFELRGARFLHGVAPAVVSFYGHKLDLTLGAEELRRRFAGNVRRNIRTAEESGLRVEISQSRDSILRFYQLLVRTRRRHGVPPQSRKFFLKIHEHMLKAGLGFVVLAWQGERAVAGAVFFSFSKNALYKFGASDERLQQLRPNNLVMWHGIRALAERGAHTLHFGRTAQANEGLRRFKLAWGAEEEIVDYFRFERTTRTWSTGERDLAGRAGGVFRKLPLAVNRLIGTLAYPHLD